MSNDTTEPIYGTVADALKVLAEVLPRGVPLPSQMTLRRAAHRGEITTYRRGRAVYFDLDSVRDWADLGHRVEATA